MARSDAILTDFNNAEPFPHLVMDNFMPEAHVRSFVANLPPRDSELWAQYKKKKRCCRDIDQCSPVVQEFTRDFIKFLKRQLPEWTGFDRIIADSSFAGGGIHAIPRGGALGVHVDFNELKKIKRKIQGPLYRVLNTFLYLNEDWQPEWRGGLQLHEQPVNGRPGPVAKTIEPAFNRFVCFASSDRSWHGHPHPLKCPADRERLSLAVYWYTRERPSWFQERHSTVYVK